MIPTRTCFQHFPIYALASFLAVAFGGSTHAQTNTSSSISSAQASEDTTQAGVMADVLSDALALGLGKPEAEVAAFLNGAEDKFASGSLVLRAASKRFKVGEEDLARLIEVHKKTYHSQTEDPAPSKRKQPELPPASAEAYRFAEDALLSVLLHELGHALVREFDLPILGNEETLADAFATHYATAYLPSRAPAILRARVTSLTIEASEAPRVEWEVRGEHNNDARRAYQIAALAVASDPQKYRFIAEGIEMSPRDQRSSADYGAEVHRSWRRLLPPTMMPAGQSSNEWRVTYDDGNGLIERFRDSRVVQEFTAIVRRFDWHSQITIHFREGDGGAAWNRSKRSITVNTKYLERLVKQGVIATESNTSDG